MVFTESETYTNLRLYQNELCEWIFNHPHDEPSHTPYINVFRNISSISRSDVKEYLEMEFFNFEWFLISEFNEQIYLIVCKKHYNSDLRSKTFIFPMNEQAYHTMNDIFWFSNNVSHERAKSLQVLHQILHNRENEECILTKLEQEKIIRDFLPQASLHKFPLFNVKMLDPFLYNDYEQENIVDDEYERTIVI